jgi:hypothetical protein
MPICSAAPSKPVNSKLFRLVPLLIEIRQSVAGGWGLDGAEKWMMMMMQGRSLCGISQPDTRSLHMNKREAEEMQAKISDQFESMTSAVLTAGVYPCPHNDGRVSTPLCQHTHATGSAACHMLLRGTGSHLIRMQTENRTQLFCCAARGCCNPLLLLLLLYTGSAGPQDQVHPGVCEHGLAELPHSQRVGCCLERRLHLARPAAANMVSAAAAARAAAGAAAAARAAARAAVRAARHSLHSACCVISTPAAKTAADVRRLHTDLDDPGKDLVSMEWGE